MEEFIINSAIWPSDCAPAVLERKPSDRVEAKKADFERQPTRLNCPYGQRRTLPLLGS